VVRTQLLRSGLAGVACLLLVPATAPGQAADPVIAAAGDIACDPITDSSFNGGEGTATNCRQKHTSNLLVDAGLTAVLALGDTQYSDGTAEEFAGSYDPTWGRVKDITWAAVGNHEYRTPDAADYFAYFGSRAGEVGKGYYSFDIGDWHLIALNSMCDEVGGCEAGSAQEQWLRADLAANADAPCTLAFWHHPLFNSGPNPDAPSSITALWQALYDAGADLVLNGHSHAYEPFAPQDPQGNAEPRFGLRQFVVGTGGHSHSLPGPEQRQPNSELRDITQFGVLKLVLHANSYDWTFVTEAGQAFHSGSAACHGPPDFAPPETSIVSAPQGVITQREASFSFASSEPGSSFTCRLDGPGSTIGPETSCGSPKSYSGLVDGAYTFSVYAVDAAGNADSSSATQSFTVDATPPETSITSGPTAATTAREASFEFSSPETDARFECRRNSGNWGACTSPVAYTSLPRDSHTFEVRALDPYGNADSSPASQTWAVERPSQYRPGSYDVLSGDVFGNRGGIRRLYKNDGRRLEIAADEKRNGRYVSAIRVFAAVGLDELATLRGITLRVNVGSNARDAEVKVHVFKFRTRRWVRVHGPSKGRRDRGFAWSPAALPGDYVSSSGTVRVRVTGKAADPFRTRTDLVGLIIEY
jgi:hypothetical protein